MSVAGIKCRLCVYLWPASGGLRVARESASRTNETDLAGNSSLNEHSRRSTARVFPRRAENGECCPILIQ